MSVHSALPAMQGRPESLYGIPIASSMRNPNATTERTSPREMPLDQLEFRRLKHPDEIASIAHLREEIRLSESVRSDPNFSSREKKEMKTALLVPLFFEGNSSGRFV